MKSAHDMTADELAHARKTQPIHCQRMVKRCPDGLMVYNDHEAFSREELEDTVWKSMLNGWSQSGKYFIRTYTGKEEK